VAEPIQVYYVPSTHWDREWYETFQAFRYHLVELLDEVLDTLARDERYRLFQTDGQSIILEDYLEIRPEREQQIRDFAAEGRLRIGPWYTMPDENLVTGESMIRNLEEGLRVARDFGNESRVGFVCDMFGHISQLPQILAGFGIDHAFVFRGVNEVTHKGVFRWIGADGTECVAHRFGPHEGYFDYGRWVRQAWEHGTPFELEQGVKDASQYIDTQLERMGLPIALLFDGGDHIEMHPEASDMLDRLRSERKDLTIQHTGLDEYARALVAMKDRIERVFHGELRDPGLKMNDGSWVIPGVLSSRVKLKQANRECEMGLTQWVEPFGLLANQLIEQEYPHAYIRRAWRYLLENHAHDSICGCSPDQVHKDMEFRFDQCRLISKKVTEQTLHAVAARVSIDDLEEDAFAMVVFNPTQRDIDGPVDLELWFDENIDKIYIEFFGFEKKIGFRLFTADGEEIPYDYVSHWPQRRRFSRPRHKIPMGQECHVVEVCCHLQVPAFGYTTLLVKPLAEPTRYPVGKIVQGDRRLENEHLAVTVNDNGSLSLHDKRSDQTYDRLLVFEDRADIGDGWYHGVAVNDQIISSTAAHAEVAVIADGGQVGTLRVTHRMQVPRDFDFDIRMRRSQETAELVIQADITLRAGGEQVELKTVIDNQIRQHRIRVLFESGVDSKTYQADSPFDVVTRDIALPELNHTFRELAVETRPQQNWTAVNDAQRGLAVVAPGLNESAVRDDPQRTLALTLLRGFKRTIFHEYPEGHDGGQSLGRHEFRYRLVPLAGAVDAAVLTHHAQLISGGLRGVQVLGKHQPPAAERSLATTAAPLRLDPGQAIVHSLRLHPEKQYVEIRLHNPTDESITEQLHYHRPVQSATLTDFDGRELSSLTVAGQAVTVTLAPRKIATIAIELA
jgi:alpha-mannosidase